MIRRFNAKGGKGRGLFGLSKGEPRFLKEFKGLGATFWQDAARESHVVGFLTSMTYWFGGRYIITRDRFGFFKQWSYEKK